MASLRWQGVTACAVSCLVWILAAASSAAAPAGAGSGQNGHTSGNFAGYVVPSKQGVTSISATWKAPHVVCSEAANSFSNAWVGVGAIEHAKWPFPQAGTDSDCIDGKPHYDAWCSRTSFQKYPVAPLDQVRAIVWKASGSWYCRVDDITAHRSSGNHRLSYKYAKSNDGTHADFIVERPTTQTTGKLLNLADFGVVRLRNMAVTPRASFTDRTDRYTMMSGTDVLAATSLKPLEVRYVVPKNTPVLGSSAVDQLPGGVGSYQGFGQIRPSLVHEGGDPTSEVSNIVWQSWGNAEATGSGTAIYGSAATGSVEKATIVAFDLGTCGTGSAYEKVEWYFPQDGQAFDPSMSFDTCTGEQTTSPAASASPPAATTAACSTAAIMQAVAVYLGNPNPPAATATGTPPTCTDGWAALMTEEVSNGQVLGPDMAIVSLSGGEWTVISYDEGYLCSSLPSAAVAALGTAADCIKTPGTATSTSGTPPDTSAATPGSTSTATPTSGSVG
jgi:hypothetical protein